MTVKKKAVLITGFEAYENRILAAEKTLTAKGYDVTVIESDFRHLQKERRRDSRENLLFVRTYAYRKNLSVARLWSHYRFSRDAFRLVEKIDPDLLYVTVPPNALVKFAHGYKKEHPGVKVLFDVLDLWPESLPMHGIENTFPCKIWRSLRDRHIGCADFVFTECELFRDKLEKHLPAGRCDILYLSRKVRDFNGVTQLPENSVSLGYLGSINNIIDIPRICDLVTELKALRPVTVHVIGNGENRELFLNSLKDAGARVEYYGEIYDAAEKQRIFDGCHFGLNVMKNTVCVGLTMKSIDYFEAGLPIINNIPKDTKNLIRRFDAGVCYENDPKKTAREIIDILDGDYLPMRDHSRVLFETLFSEERHEEILLSGMEIAERGE